MFKDHDNLGLNEVIEVPPFPEEIFLFVVDVVLEVRSPSCPWYQDSFFPRLLFTSFTLPN